MSARDVAVVHGMQEPWELTKLIAETASAISSAIGQVVMVCMENRAYLSWSISDTERLFLPPLKLLQYRTFLIEGERCGFCTWAWLSEDASRYIQCTNEDPRPYEWRSGPHLWIVDLVCRPGLSSAIARHLHSEVFAPGSPDRLFKNRKVRALRRDEDGKVRKFASWILLPDGE